MSRVSATEVGKAVGRYQDVALSEPVIGTSNGRDRTVVIAAEEYRRLKRRDRTVYAAGELPDEIVEAIARTEMDPRHDHLNSLIEDWKPCPSRSRTGTGACPSRAQTIDLST